MTGKKLPLAAAGKQPPKKKLRTGVSTTAKAKAKKAVASSKVKVEKMAELNKKQRAPNYNKIEDIQLCKAYMNVSLDPVVGADQKADEFWRRIHELFEKLMDELPPDQIPDVVEVRDQQQLKTRLQKKIQPPCLVFSSHWKTVADGLESGRSEDEIPKLTTELYEEHEEHKWRFQHCWDILKDHPKFDPDRPVDSFVEGIVDDDGSDTDDDDDDNNNKKRRAAVNNTSLPMAAGMERPVGTRKAKKLARDEKSLQSINSQSFAASAAVAAASTQLAEAMSSRNKILDSRNKVLKNMKTISEQVKIIDSKIKSGLEMMRFSRDMGNMEEAGKKYAEVQALREQQEKLFVELQRSREREDSIVANVEPPLSSIKPALHHQEETTPITTSAKDHDEVDSFLSEEGKAGVLSP